ncbi:helix-turn-helix transcriptional regulator [Mesorhizobium abyssinicae]|uniref:Helix-turn-helix transcriptional regulator n=1 Tax=Mesorhizobium abyssinicae TaxID=1209958 RepID=A0ABU5ASE0_9HYPH|nr:helix-turn-helix transcriptional regulator [Mesorhizobium abyssinicae]MDX8540109.1 helix-turn-helix transcriptional regulator [Mesorhizobium abyssinicae]
MNARNAIGWNLRKFRVARGLSQERLALEAGIDRAYLGRIERGSENVTVAILELLAKVLDVSVGRLFDEPEPGSARPGPLRSGRKPRKDRTD